MLDVVKDGNVICVYIVNILYTRNPKMGTLANIFFCLFCCFTSHVNSYGHGGTVSSPNHIFSWASLNNWLTSTYFRL